MASNSTQANSTQPAANANPTSSNAPAASTNAPAASASNAPTTSSTVSAAGPDDRILTALFINDNSWPADFILDFEKANWEEWSLRLKLLAARQGFSHWLKGTLAQPDVSTHSKAHHIWENNDESLKACILSHISRDDFRLVSNLSTSHAVFEALQKRHEKQGLHAQMVLIKKAMSIQCKPDVLLCKTADEIQSLYTRISNMGIIDQDRLLTVFLVNSLNEHFDSLQSSVMTTVDDPNFSSSTILRRFSHEDDLTRHRLAQNPQASTALAAQS